MPTPAPALRPRRPFAARRCRWLLLSLFVGQATPALAETRPESAPVTEDLPIAVQFDVTFMGSQQAAADPELNPIHYRFLTRGYVNFGTAREGDLEPERNALLQHLAAALRPLGYLPADADHPPRVALAVLWGSSFSYPRHTREFLNTSSLPLKWEPLPDHSVRKNERIRDNFPGIPGDTLSRITRLSFNDSLLLAVTACDFQNAAAGREVPLWQVRAFMPVDRITAEAAFHRAIDALAPDFGRAFPHPRLIRAPAERAALASRFGVAESADLPAPADLLTLVAHDFGDSHFAPR